VGHCAPCREGELEDPTLGKEKREMGGEEKDSVETVLSRKS